MYRTILSQQDIDDLKTQEQEISITLENENEIAIGAPTSTKKKTAKKELTDIRDDLTKDSYGSRIIKYIPYEVICAYLACCSAAKIAPEDVQFWLFVTAFLACIWLTYAYLNKVERVKKKTQLWISTVAFILWAQFVPNTLGIPFWIPSFIVPLYTLIAAIHIPEKGKRARGIMN